MRKFFLNKRGVTLIELIIYISLVSVILVVTLNFGWRVLLGQIKTQFIREVQQNGRLSLEQINRLIRQASAINSPSPGGFDTVLSLEMPDYNLDPTVINISENKILITQGGNSPVEITNNKVKVKNLRFTNLSYDNTPGIVSVEIDIEHVDSPPLSSSPPLFTFKSSTSLMPGGIAASEPGTCQGISDPCNIFTDSVSCTNQDGCQWNPGSCQGECTPCGQLGLFDCFFQDGCSWNWWRWRCQGTCASCDGFGNQSDCESQSGCVWENYYCYGEAVSCEEYTTEVSCSSQQGCEWLAP